MKNTGKVSTSGAVGGGGTKAPKEVQSATKAMTTGLKESGQAALDSAAGFDKLGGPLKSFGKSLKNSSTAFKGTLAGIGLLGAAIGKYIKSVNQSVTVLRGLADSGVQFQGSFVEVSGALATTGLTLEHFGEMADKYARVMGQNGLQGLLKLTTATEDAAGGFSRFGLTTAEATEYAAEYLDQQRMAGVFGKASEAQQAQALQKNIERLTAYSKVLNVSRKDLQDASREMLSNADLQAELFSMAPEQRAAAQAAFAETAQSFAAMGPAGLEMGKIFTDIAASPVAEASDGFQQLANAGLGDLAQRMVKLSEANKAGEGASIEQLLAMANLTDAEKEQLSALRLAGDEIKNTAVMVSSFGQASAEAEVSLAKHREAAAEAGLSMEDYMKTVDENAAAQAHLQDELSKFEATAEYGMVKAFSTLLGGKGTDAVNMAADALGVLNDKARTFIDGPMVEGIEAFKDKAMEVWGVLKEIFADLGVVINDWVIKPFKAAGEFINSMFQGLLVGWGKFMALLDKIPGIDISSPQLVEPTMATVTGINALHNEGTRGREAARQLATGLETGADDEVLEALRQIIENTREGARQGKKVAKATEGGALGT
jgi:hypothetical protein